MEPRKKNFGPIPFFFAFALSACIPSSPPPTPPIQTLEFEEETAAESLSVEGIDWVLHRLNDQEVLEEEKVTLSFHDSIAQGNDGCVDYSSPYAVDGSTFAVGHISTSEETESPCPAPLMEQAQAYRLALGIAAAYTLEEQHLQLQAADGRILAVFIAPGGQQQITSEAQFEDLSDSTWRVQAYSDGQAMIQVMERFRIPTVEFRADGNIGGSAGCNSYLGVYTYPEEGNSLRINRVAVTSMQCEPFTRMEQEERFIEALNRSMQYHQRGNALELQAEDGSPTLLLLRDTP